MPKREATVMMKLHRNFSLSSTLGHVITFKKDVPMPVPAVMVRSCAEIGAVRVDGEDAFETPEPAKEPQPIDPGHRLEDILSAFFDIVERNEREDFTAAGIPTVACVSKEVGYKVDRNEVLKAWRQRAEDLANDTE